MKLKKFRIRNYKSIIDSGYCTLASDMTVLVGKNESGKTATLEALRFLDKSVNKAPKEAFPVDGNINEPQIEACFTLTREKLQEIEEASGVKLDAETADAVMTEGLTIIKDSQGRYHLNQNGLKGTIEDRQVDDPVFHIRNAKERLHTLLNTTHFPNIDFDSGVKNIQRQSKNFVKVVKSKLPAIPDEEAQMEVVEAIRTIVRESVRLTEPRPQEQEAVSSELNDDSAGRFIEEFAERMPNFIYFSEFSDILPFEVPIDKLKTNQAVLDYARISGLDLDHFMSIQDVQRRVNFLNRHSAEVCGNFHDYWGQEKVELIVKSEGYNILFGIKEEGKPDFFKIEQRSKGFQWFLSFYLRIKAQMADNNIIIIDEPGVNLHASAQKEILKMLQDEIASQAQVIYSTHCPYLIDARRLDRIRIVIKDREKGSVVSDDVHGLSGEECMAPVMTALGGEPTNLTPITGMKNVIVGSMHDFYFWKAMRPYLSDLKGIEEINLVPSVDAAQAGQLIAMFISYEQDFRLLLNHNNEGWKTGQQLKEGFGFDENRIIFVSEKLGYFSEDLFTFEDFRDHVVTGEVIEEQAVLNSTFMRNKGLNKVMIARSFYEKTAKFKDLPELSAETIAAFRETYSRILKSFQDPAAMKGQNTDPNALNDKPAQKGGVKRKSLFAFLRNK